MTHNEKKMTVCLQRIDLCDILLALTITGSGAPDGGEKWEKLHDELKKQLDEFDKAAGL